MPAPTPDPEFTPRANGAWYQRLVSRCAYKLWKAWIHAEVAIGRRIAPRWTARRQSRRIKKLERALGFID